MLAVAEVPMSLGMLRYTLELVARLPGDLAELCVAVYDPNISERYVGRMLPRLIGEYRERFGLEAYELYPVPLPVLRRTINYKFLMPLKLARLARRARVVHSFNHLTPVGLKYAELAGRKMVATVYDLIPLRLPKWYGGPDLTLGISSLRRLWLKCDAIVTISEASKEDLVALGIPEEKIRVIYPAVDRRRFKPIPRGRAREELGWEPSDFVVLYVGSGEPKRLFPLKALMRGIKDLLEEGKVKLVLAGPYKAVAPRTNGSVQVLRNPPDKLLPLLYSACDVFVFPTLAEGFGIPCLEAMSCGAPVIVPRNTSLPEVAGDAGVYVEDPLSPEEWRTAVRMLLEDPGLRKRLSKKALARAKEFSWERSAEQLRALYEELLGR